MGSLLEGQRRLRPTLLGATPLQLRIEALEPVPDGCHHILDGTLVLLGTLQ